MPVAVRSRLRRRLRLSLLHALAGKILKAAGASRSDLSLLLVGDGTMRRLNRRYRRKDRTTDVLAFPMPVTRHVSPVTPAPLGDVVISLPQAARQAARAGHSLERELAVLVTHGVLHLLGYDHERSGREARRMLRREQAVLRRVERAHELA